MNRFFSSDLLLVYFKSFSLKNVMHSFMVLNGLDISDPVPLFVIRSILKLISICSLDLVLAFFCMELSGGCILLNISW